MKEAVVKIGGGGIRYVEEGETGARPLLYIHGNTGSARWFERVMRVPGWRTLALDLPNFGASDPLPGRVSIAAYADAVVGFCDALGLDRPLLAAHSLGGAVALELAARLPSAWRGLVLVDSASPTGLKTPVDRHPLIDLMRTDRAFLAQALKAVVPGLADPVFFEALVDDAFKMAAPAWIGNAVALSDFNLAGRLASFAAPVLVLWGRKDAIVTEAMAVETRDAFLQARLEILEGVGHSVIVEDPGLFLRHLAAFSAGLAS
jgi:branched-chain amino acid transport system permease protein